MEYHKGFEVLNVAHMGFVWFDWWLLKTIIFSTVSILAELVAMGGIFLKIRPPKP